MPPAPPWRAHEIVGVFVLLGWVLWVYSGGWVDLARNDHLAFLQELAMADGVRAKLQHTLGYDTSRFMSEEFQPLFRPVFWAWHALLEVFLQVGEKGRGVAGLLLVYVAAVALYAYARRIADPILAACATWSAATMYTGFDLVTWRHITPYLLAPVGLVCALPSLASGRPGVATALLLLACALDHELSTASIAACFAASWLSRNRPSMVATGVPLLVVAAIRFVRWVSTPAGINVFEASSGKLTAWVAGNWLLGWLLPSAFDAETERWNRTMVSAPNLAPLLVSVAGAALVAVLLVLLGRSLATARRVRVDHTTLAVLLVAPFVLALSVTFSAMRVAMHGPDYVGYASYYHGLVAYLLTTLTIAFASRTSRTGQRAVAIVFVVLTLQSTIGLRAALTRIGSSNEAVYRVHAGIRQALDAQPGACFGGLLRSADEEWFPPALPFASLGARPCSMRGGTPEVLEQTDDGLRLVRRSDPTDFAPLDGSTDLRAVRAVFAPPSIVVLEVSDGTRRVEIAGSDLWAHVEIDGMTTDRLENVFLGPKAPTHEIAIAIVEDEMYGIYDGVIVSALARASILPASVSVSVVSGPAEGLLRVEGTRTPTVLDRNQSYVIQR